MPSKLEQAVSYIRDLKIGARVSIKSIASELSISEGTAYHAIKRAEQEGLVVTLPKAGTTRVEKTQAADAPQLTLAKIQHLIRATVLSGKPLPETTIRHLHVGNGSLKDLEDAFACSGEDEMCILGDRPDLQSAAVANGVHLLLTDRAPVSEELLSRADRNGVAVLRTAHSAFAALHLLGQTADSRFPFSIPSTVKEWMHPPQFLYNDDLVADWYRIFNKQAISKIPILDENMHICGCLSAEMAQRAEPSRRVETVCQTAETFRRVTESDSMMEVAEYMMLEDLGPVLVMEGEELIGMLTLQDVLRFYQYFCSSTGGGPKGALIEPVAKLESDGKWIYSLRIPLSPCGSQATDGESLLSLILAAAGMHCREHFGVSGTPESVTYFSTRPLDQPSELLLSIEMARSAGECFVLDCELYDDGGSYARCSVFFHRKKKTRE